MSSNITPNINARNIARSLEAGQSMTVNGPGDYKFSQDGVVWEINDGHGGNRVKSTLVGEWLAGLAVACNLEIESDDIANIAFQLGKLIGREGFVEVLN